MHVSRQRKLDELLARECEQSADSGIGSRMTLRITTVQFLHDRNRGIIWKHWLGQWLRRFRARETVPHSPGSI